MLKLFVQQLQIAGKGPPETPIVAQDAGNHQSH